MIVHTEKNAYECATAERYLDGVHLLDDDGNIILIVAQPNRIKNVECGEITVIEKPDPSEEEDISALIVDHEYRLTLLELGITE